MSKVFKVICISGDAIEIKADDFEANKDSVAFIKNGLRIAWFYSANLVGFIKE